MASLNEVTLMGNLTRDIDLRYTPNGAAIAQTGLAMNRKWKHPKTGELKEDVTFVDLLIWGKQGEMCKQYVAKGRSVLIKGRLNLEKWTDKQTGKPRQKLVVVAERVIFLGGKQPGQAPAQQQQQAPASTAAAPQEQAPEDLDIQEDNIPF